MVLDGRPLVNVGANDYLGYAGDVRLAKAAAKASCADGFGAGASPLVSGHSRAHDALERAIAGLLEADAALVFPSGFAANTAAIAALAGTLGQALARSARIRKVMNRVAAAVFAGLALRLIASGR